MNMPRATYRLQLHAGFPFAEVSKILDYLDRLGVSHLYASPIFKARQGSSHGYDVVDPTQINPELGSATEFDTLIQVMHDRGLGWIQDIVPNHMAYDRENGMLMDILESGPNSEYHHFFDIEWNHPYESMRGRVLAPFLGEPYAVVLERGEIQLCFGDGVLLIIYHEIVYPLRLESYPVVLSYDIERLRRRLGSDHPDYIKLLGVLYVLKNLSSNAELSERTDQVKFVKRILLELYQKNLEIRSHLDSVLKTFNGIPGKPETFHLLDRLLTEQYFRLAHWKVAGEEINYRRFFTINGLISLHTEDERVFNYVHSLVLKLIQEGKIDGLRIDHIDGLYDPEAYLVRLQEHTPQVYITVEKILQHNEKLSSAWEIEGTTGYDFLNYVTGVFCECRSEQTLRSIYHKFADFTSTYENVLSGSKRFIIGKLLAGDVERMAILMKDVFGKLRHGRDITMYGLKRALVEMLACFPVYRTYIKMGAVTPEDQNAVREAIRQAKESAPELASELNFVEQFLLMELVSLLSPEEIQQTVHFVQRFQQLTGPIMAKGFEDSFLYIYNCLLSLNEVGGNPKQFGCSLEDFHVFIQERIQNWPHTQNATATHDTKRGEDARARINVLSEIPDEWREHLYLWQQMNAPKKTPYDGWMCPDANAEYLIYQSMLGGWPMYRDEEPAFLERLIRYIQKAGREAKVHTEWTNPDQAYEKACANFIRRIFDENESADFLSSFRTFSARISHYGRLNSLGQTLLKMTAPGIPDFYQGCELWDLTFVDPDNRQPVNFVARTQMLDEIQAGLTADPLTATRETLLEPFSGRIKLMLIFRVLQFRKNNPRLFENGGYIPLLAEGIHCDSVIAFARFYEDQWIIVVVPRYCTRLVPEDAYPLGASVWGDTRLTMAEGPQHWRNIITGERMDATPQVSIGTLLENFPVGLWHGHVK